VVEKEDARHIVVVGIGNLHRGDDAAGRVVAQSLRGKLPEGVRIAEIEGDAGSLLAIFNDYDSAVLVDACVSGAPAGTVHRFDVSRSPLPQLGARLSTHGFGLAETIELARALGQLPSRCVVYAIEGNSFGSGERLSHAVEGAVAGVTAQLSVEF
jgi:hydrogenase maturation protease